MIFLRIVSNSESKIEEIASELLSQKLVIDVNLRRNIERAQMVNGKLVYTNVFLLTAKTRAVLFNAIDDLLNEMYPNHLPEVYALPIMQMDWKQAQSLTSDVKSIKPKGRIHRVIDRIRKNKKRT